MLYISCIKLGQYFTFFIYCLIQFPNWTFRTFTIESVWPIVFILQILLKILLWKLYFPHKVSWEVFPPVLFSRKNYRISTFFLSILKNSLANTFIQECSNFLFFLMSVLILCFSRTLLISCKFSNLLAWSWIHRICGNITFSFLVLSISAFSLSLHFYSLISLIMGLSILLFFPKYHFLVLLIFIIFLKSTTDFFSSL